MSRTEFNKIVNLDDFSKDVSRIEDLSDRIRLAGYGLVNPLVQARAAQMKREAERTAKRKGADHPEVALRLANADRANTQFALFSEELNRARISRPEFDVEKGAAIWGRVVDDGLPQSGLTVSAIGDGVRLDFECTDDVGSFALELPIKTELVLSVKNKDGAEIYRDPESFQLETGQQQYHEIDLTRGTERPCPEPGPGVQPQETFKMLDLVDRTEAVARSLLANQGLKLGKRTTELVEKKAGLIISHQPKAGAKVKRGDSIDIVVGASAQVQVPDLIGLTLERAKLLLDKTGLVAGKLTQVPVKQERAGLIVAQTPLPGSLSDRGGAVKLSIGIAEEGGSDLITVPDVTGGSVADADAKLKQAKLKRGSVSEVPVPAEKAGIVVGQSPSDGTKVPPETAVALVVGKLAESGNKVTVPDVRGKSLGDAKAILEAAKLEVGKVANKVSENATPGTILNQTPPPGSLVSTGDPVDLVVAKKRDNTEPTAKVPSVTGITFEKAEAKLKKAGFKANKTDRRVIAPAQIGIVLAQQPKAGSTAQVGTAVTLVVGVRRPGRPDIDPKVAKLAESAQAELMQREILPANTPKGALLTLLSKAGVKTVGDVEELLTRDRRELRDVLGLRTLSLTDQAIRALKRALEEVNG